MSGYELIGVFSFLSIVGAFSFLSACRGILFLKHRFEQAKEGELQALLAQQRRREVTEDDGHDRLAMQEQVCVPKP